MLALWLLSGKLLPWALSCSHQQGGGISHQGWGVFTGFSLLWSGERKILHSVEMELLRKVFGLCFFSSFRFALVLPGVKNNCQQFTRKGNVSFPVEENIKGLIVKGKGKLKNATWLPPSCVSPQQICLCWVTTLCLLIVAKWRTILTNYSALTHRAQQEDNVTLGGIRRTCPLGLN